MVIGIHLIACIATLLSTKIYAYLPLHGSILIAKYHKSREVPKAITSQKLTSLAATGISEKEENVLSKSKEREVNSGLFRKISQSNKVFDYDEILSSDDVDEYQRRFHSLMALFPEVPETELRTLVFISPLLLALETSSLRTAVDRLRYELPFIDPSYVIAQRSCGLDLLLSCMSPLFDLDTRRNDVISVIGKERNVTEFLRRVPHCLTPRYLVALRDHCITLKEFLHLDTKASLDIVERWPGILGIDLTQSLTRFNTSLQKLELVPVHETSTFFLTKILRSVPRSLMQDMPRRAYLLRQSFPLWDLPTIISKYPRILTQKIQGLKNQYETLQSLLDPLEISADNFINMSPRSLGYNPHQLLATAHSIAAVLPGLTVHDIYKRVPRLLSVRTKEVLLPQVKKLKKSFSTTKSGHSNSGENKKSGHDNVKVNKIEIVESKNGMERSTVDVESTVYSPTGRADYIDDDEDSFYGAYSSESEEQGRIRMAQIFAKIGAKDAKEAAEYNTKKGGEKRVSIHPGSKEHANNLSSPAGVSELENIPHNFAHAAKIEEINEFDDGSEINVTRIIIGNLNIFIDRYPYFVDKVNGWIKDFGPSLAYAVLSAVPAVLTKKTTTVRPILKRLYTLIAEAGSLNNVPNKESVASEVTRTNSALYGELNVLLLEAPSLLKKKPTDVDIRLQQLADLLEHSAVTEKHVPLPSTGSTCSVILKEVSSLVPKECSKIMEAQVLAVRVPRLLIESKMDRIIFRSRLLFYFQKNSSNMSNKKKTQNSDVKIKKKVAVSSVAERSSGVGAFKIFGSVVEGCPQVLAAPSSTLARLFFASTYLGKSKSAGLPVTNKSSVTSSGSKILAPLTASQIEQLLDCNTKSFLRCLALLGGEECDVLDSAYGMYLQSLLKNLTPVPVQSTLISTLSSLQSAPLPTLSNPQDSEEDLEPEDSVFKLDGESDTPTGPHPAAVDLGSSDFERLLCGVFNDLSAAPLTAYSGANERENIDSVSSPKNALNVGSKNVLSISAEVERIDRLCQRVGSVLTDLAR